MADGRAVRHCLYRSGHLSTEEDCKVGQVPEASQGKHWDGCMLSCWKSCSTLPSPLFASVLSEIDTMQQVNMGYKLWGTGTDVDSEEDEETLSETVEERTLSSSGAHSSNGSSSAGSSRNGSSSHSDADGTVWGPDVPDSDDYEGGDALSRGSARFWTFRREDVKVHQAGSENRAYSSSSGWTVLEPSSSEPLGVDLEAVHSNGVTKQGSSEIQLQEDNTGEDMGRLAWDETSSAEDSSTTSNGAAAASSGLLPDVELRQSPASTSGQQFHSAGEVLPGARMSCM